MSNKKPHRELSLAGVMLVAALLLAGCDDTAPVNIAPGDSRVGEQVLEQADGDGVLAGSRSIDGLEAVG